MPSPVSMSRSPSEATDHRSCRRRCRKCRSSALATPSCWGCQSSLGCSNTRPGRLIGPLFLGLDKDEGQPTKSPTDPAPDMGFHRTPGITRKPVGKIGGRSRTRAKTQDISSVQHIPNSVRELCLCGFFAACVVPMLSEGLRKVCAICERCQSAHPWTLGNHLLTISGSLLTGH